MSWAVAVAALPNTTGTAGIRIRFRVRMPEEREREGEREIEVEIAREAAVAHNEAAYFAHFTYTFFLCDFPRHRISITLHEISYQKHSWGCRVLNSCGGVLAILQETISMQNHCRLENIALPARYLPILSKLTVLENAKLMTACSLSINSGKAR